MDIKAIQASYARWAPVYDKTFGAVTNAGRMRTTRFVNRHAREVLEVGVGTGLALPHYAPEVNVTAIDYSEDMLRKARKRVAEMNLRNVRELRQMDARSLDFPDNRFDAVVAMHVLSVVPDPEQVMSEIARVCKPGGRVIITNHFASGKGPLALLERAFAPLESLIGWHSDFEIETVLQEDSLALEERRKLPPLGMMTFLVLKKMPG